MRPAEPGGVDEPEMEPGEVIDAVHPVGVAGAPEARMRGRPHCEALGHLREPPGPPTVAAGAVEHQQWVALPADPGVHADTADRDGLLSRSHAPYYAPAMEKLPGDALSVAPIPSPPGPRRQRVRTHGLHAGVHGDRW